jgi:acyl-CoA synthetase (NDP forming)
MPLVESVTAVTRPGEILDEAQSYEVLSALGVPVIEHRIVPVAAFGDAVPFPGQMVVKALSQQLPHKSEAGGVRPAVTAETLPTALQSVADAVNERAGVRLDHCLVAPMVSALAEVLVGYRVDPEAGPLVVLASGGVLAELYGDRSVRCAPVDLHEARSMIAEVRALQAVAGYRGGELGDLEALAEAIVAMSQASTSSTPIWEAEVNPLMVLPRGQGVVAVDALVVLAGTQA